MKLTKELIALQNIASTDKTKQTLQCVYIDPNKKEAYSSDGNCACIKTLSKDELSEIVIDKPSLVKFNKPKLAKSPHFGDHAEHYKILGNVGAGTNLKNTLEIIQEDLNYPDINQVVPKFDKSVKLGISASLLLKLAEVLCNFSKDNIVTLEIKVMEDGIDPLAPIKVTGSDNSKLGVIMPCRL